jgi:hypothetical protein
MSMMTGPTTTGGEQSCESQPHQSGEPDQHFEYRPGDHCAGDVPHHGGPVSRRSAALAPMIPKERGDEGKRHALDNRQPTEPKVACTSVATPLHSMTEEISVAMLRAWASACAAWIAGSAPASTGHSAGPNSSGIATVEPNMVKTC